LVAVAACRRAHRRTVRAGSGLGERIRTQPFPARELRQVALLLLVAAGELEPEGTELLHSEDQPARRADLRDLLDRDEREQRPATHDKEEPCVTSGSSCSAAASSTWRWASSSASPSPQSSPRSSATSSHRSSRRSAGSRTSTD